MTNEIECDVLVLGAGVAGLATALSAAHSGLDVIVAEKSQYFGGTAAVSAGWAWVPGNPRGMAATSDTREDMTAYLKALAPDTFDAGRVDAFLDTVPKAIEFFESQTKVIFSYPEKAPDYRMELPGAKVGGRAILPADADARMLGERRKELQPYLSSYTVFGYMPQVGDDLSQFLKANRSLRSFLYAARRLVRTWWDTAVHGAPLKRTNGSALITRMARSALDAGVEIWTSTPVEKLLRDDAGAVTGAVIGGAHNGVVRARTGVVLAGGGFSGDEELRKKYFPHDATGKEHFTPTYGHDGSSARLAMRAGGRLNADVSSVASWAPITVYRHLTGRRRVFPHLRQIGLPGMITVDRYGRRFGNEALSYHDFGGAMIRHNADQTSTFAWVVGDQTLMRKYGIGFAKPWPVPRWGYYRTGFLVKGRTLEELARKTGIDERGLRETLERFNHDAVAGEDTEFGRGSTAYNHFRGDLEHKPNPNLAPLSTPPFYATKVRMGDLGTFAGIDVDADGAVLAEAGPIPGLYAVGSSAVSVFGGGYPGYGSHIGPALVFGYRLGRDLAR